MKYNHDATWSKDEIKNYKYINYKQGLELHDPKKFKIKYQEMISSYLHRIKILNSYVTKKNSTAVFINQVRNDGLKLEKLFILNHSLIEYCKDVSMHCINLAAKLNGKFNYWTGNWHTTGLGSKVIAETVIDDLIKIIKQENIF